MGAQAQLLGELMQPCDFHGTDGMGDAPDADPPASSINVRLAPGVPLLLDHSSLVLVCVLDFDCHVLDFPSGGIGPSEPRLNMDGCI